MANTATWLLGIRRAYGANSEIGHLASNLDEMRQNKARTADPEQLRQLDANEKVQWDRLGEAFRTSTVSRGDR